MDSKFGPYCSINPDLSVCNTAFELLCLDIKKTGNCHTSIICMYRPPKGEHPIFNKYLENALRNLKTEIWILDDINVDYLNRADENRNKYLRLFKRYGLRQYIDNITRPNTRGGTCIDWVVTNSAFVKHAGVTNDFISDHLTIYAVRKKKRENNKSIYRVVRDLTNFDTNIYKNLLQNENWELFDNCENVDELWNLFYKKMYDILSIMCPLKSYKQRETVTPRLTPEIYRTMHERDKYIKLFRATRFHDHSGPPIQKHSR